MTPPNAPDPATTAAWIQDHPGPRPRLGLVLGSGFSGIAQAIEPSISLPYADIPGFAATTVPGHPGRLLLARWCGVPVAVLAGRYHAYEGHSLATVTFPIRVLAALGIDTLLLTNAAGGIRPDLTPGDLVVLTDHLNLLGDNPLRPLAGPSGFLDLTDLYDPALRLGLRRAADREGLTLKEGIYAAVAGPSYETPAEVRALGRLGADLVGMSTVPEAIVGRHCGLRVAALSCVTNRAAGLGGRIAHGEVIEVGRRVGPDATRLLRRFIEGFAAESPMAG